MKGQTLPWVAINVVGMITFVIILISILSMQKNFYMTTKELDKRAALMQMGHEFLTSPNCVASEFTDYSYLNSSRRVKLIDIVNPGVIDYYKYMDFYHFNCMRFDFKHLEKNGMTMAYTAKLVDVNTGDTINKPIPLSGKKFWPPNGTIYSYEANTKEFPADLTLYGQKLIECNYPPNCSDKLYQIQPVLIKKGNDIHLGVLYFSVCDDKSKDYEGTQFCQQNLK